ncbi:MAG: DUF899 family protein [Gammaproteobacteria bacterium]
MTTNYAQQIETLNGYRQQIGEIRAKMREVQESIEPQPVENYRFTTGDAEVKLGELFTDKPDLIVIHNMGTSCAYCTLWADGFNGIYDHLRQRADFVVTSPDSPSVQARFAQKRGWTFPMVSHQGSSFATDMGFGSADEGWMPGVSVFQQRDGGVVRVSHAQLGPYDDFCALWHLFNLLPKGADAFAAKFSYD